MEAKDSFKLTYATMFNPPEEMHQRYEQALEKVKASLGREYGHIINGSDGFSSQKIEDRSPINTDILLGVFQKGNGEDARAALQAARQAFPVWSRMKWQERVALVRKAAQLIDQRIYELAAVLSLEVGKNRMEALGDGAEAADLFRYACDAMETHHGFVVDMTPDPLAGYHSKNVSVMRPYGVWVVISPFNFPAALTGGPLGAALVAGNTVVVKPASDTPWAPRIIVECCRDAGFPEGVVNYVTGPGSSVGQVLVESPEVDGITFTGSYDVGMKIYRDYAQGRYIRPIVLELGGKNPAIVSRHADLDVAATGIIRSAFGLQGQKCSACSRVYVEEAVYNDLAARLVELANKLVVGDPTRREVNMGPVINRGSYQEYQGYCEEISQSRGLYGNGHFLLGGKTLVNGDLAKGYYCLPTLAELPITHRLWKHEMFLPITTLTRVTNLEEAIQHANDVAYGLTAGFYGTEEEGAWFFERIEAGVTYVNRPQGATTGAWPGFQPFGGWKGSGSTGKNAGGHYYLHLYLHEQSRTIIRKA